MEPVECFIRTGKQWLFVWPFSGEAVRKGVTRHFGCVTFNRNESRRFIRGCFAVFWELHVTGFGIGLSRMTRGLEDVEAIRDGFC